MEPNEFQCRVCGETFVKGWSDEEASKEYEQQYGTPPSDDTGLVCDDCYTEIQQWLATSSPTNH